jgi:transposase-like protein
MLAVADQRSSRTDDDKRRMVRALDNRGDKTADQVAEQLGVSVALLYHWRKRIKNGEPLDMRAARKGTALARVAPAAMTTAPKTSRKAEHPIVIASSTSTLTHDERDELVRLRAENARLKAALVAGLSLQEALR